MLVLQLRKSPDSTFARVGHSYPAVLVPEVSHGNPLHNVAGDAPLSAVIDLGGPGVGVAGQVLHVFEGYGATRGRC